MNKKSISQYSSKLLTIFLLGLFTGAGTFIYAASTWQDTSYIEDGQIIEAGTIKDNFDYLFERSWDVVGDVFTTSNKVALNVSSTSADLTLDVEGKVGAREYCDEAGESCVDLANSLQLGQEVPAPLPLASAQRLCGDTAGYTLTRRSGISVNQGIVDDRFVMYAVERLSNPSMAGSCGRDTCTIVNYGSSWEFQGRDTVAIGDCR